MTGVFDDPSFSYFAFYAVLIVFKVLFMVVFVAIQRGKSGAFPNPEDYKGKKTVDGKPMKPIVDDEVERIRRCHLNDIENVFPYVLIGFLYVASGPTLATAILHFRLFTAARFIHTFAYLLTLPHGVRAVTFATGFLVTVSMGVQVLMTASY